MGVNKDITALTGQKHPTCRSHERGNFEAAGNGWLGNEWGRKSFIDGELSQAHGVESRLPY